MGNRWLPWIGVGMVIAVVSLSMYFELYDAWAFFGIMFYTFLFFVFIAFLSYDSSRRIAEKKRMQVKKSSLSDCWNKTNDLLRRMPGGEGLEWAKGFGRKSELRYFGSGENKKTFRSLYGNLSKSRQLVVIIFDVEEQVIARYVANPTPALISDPFHKFDPMNSQSSQRPFDYRDRSRYGLSSRYRGRQPYGYGRPPQDGGDNYANYDSLPVSPTREEIDKAQKIFDGEK